jgi:hypothetical protein
LFARKVQCIQEILPKQEAETDMDKLTEQQKALLAEGLKYHIAISRRPGAPRYTAFAPELDYLFWGDSVEDITADAPAKLLDVVLCRAECGDPFALPQGEQQAWKTAALRMKRDPELMLTVAVASRRRSSDSAISESTE